MNEIITINEQDTQFPVDGRELHERLGVETRYNDWFHRMCKYGFTEGTDFNSLKNERVSPRPLGNGVILKKEYNSLENGVLDKNVHNSWENGVSLKNEQNHLCGRPASNHRLTLSMAKEICMLQRTEKGREIRKYLIQVEELWNSPDAIMQRALQIASARVSGLKGEVEKLEAKVQQDAPKVLFADAVSAADTTILIGDLAKLLHQNGVDIGQKRLFQRLRDEGFLIKRAGTDYNMPTQRAMEMGLFRVKETAVTHADGHVSVNRTTKVTGKGQQYFINRYLAKKA